MDVLYMRAINSTLHLLRSFNSRVYPVTIIIWHIQGCGFASMLHRINSWGFSWMRELHNSARNYALDYVGPFPNRGRDSQPGKLLSTLHLSVKYVCGISWNSVTGMRIISIFCKQRHIQIKALYPLRRIFPNWNANNANRWGNSVLTFAHY